MIRGLPITVYMARFSPLKQYALLIAYPLHVPQGFHLSWRGGLPAVRSCPFGQWAGCSQRPLRASCFAFIFFLVEGIIPQDTVEVLRFETDFLYNFVSTFLRIRIKSINPFSPKCPMILRNS